MSPLEQLKNSPLQISTHIFFCSQPLVRGPHRGSGKVQSRNPISFHWHTKYSNAFEILAPIIPNLRISIYCKLNLPIVCRITGLQVSEAKGMFDFYVKVCP